MWRSWLLHLDAWLSDVGPHRDAHNERIKLFAGSLNAIGLASLIGGVVGPALDPNRGGGGGAAILGVLSWLTFSFAAFRLLRYIHSKD